MAKLPRFAEAIAGRSPIIEMDNRDSDFILDLRFFNSLLGPAEPPAVITMDGVIITIGETSQRKPPSVWRLFRLSRSALAARGPYGEVRCVERCSNAVPLLVWTHCLN